MEKNQNKKFVVYFEIFGIKKKYTVDNERVKTQSEAEQYVKHILVPESVKIHYLNNQKGTDSKSEQDNKPFEILNEALTNFINNLSEGFKKK